MKYLNWILLISISMTFVSCDTDEASLPIQVSKDFVEIEAEGGEIEISITGSEWHIKEVLNQNGWVKIHGNVYNLDGEQIVESKPLTLDEFGEMKALWTDKGFRITRDSPASLKLFLEENWSGKEFSFVVVLESQRELMEILVTQKQSQGYTFEKIQYYLNENDGDSLFIKEGSTYKFDIESPQEFSFSPINGIDIHRSFYFDSSEKDAFVWIKQDSVMVSLPFDINNNQVSFNGEKGLYANTIIKTEHGFNDLLETVNIPSGESEFYTELEYRKRQISYSLHLINNRTTEVKIIEGKWIEYAPTGEYSIHWQH
jgi:hypothetical protein